MKKNKEGRVDEIDEFQLRSMITKTEVTLNQFNVHLDEEINEPSMYRDLITLLFNSTENDVITFYVNCPGGHLDSALAIIEGIKVTKSHIRCILIGACHSAASMISMYAHEIIVLDSAHSLIHTATFGSIGNSNNIKTHTDFTVRQIEKFIHATYDGFLTESELVSVKAGVELWFDADQIRDRMVKRNMYLEAEEKKISADAKKQEAKSRKQKSKETTNE